MVLQLVTISNRENNGGDSCSLLLCFRGMVLFFDNTHNSDKNSWEEFKNNCSSKEASVVQKLILEDSVATTFGLITFSLS